MREHFEEELSKLSNALVEMGALCEDAISCAVKYRNNVHEAAYPTAACRY